MKCLIVFAKAPVPGTVKTRLCPPLLPEEAAHLAEAFLRDALRMYAKIGVDVRLYLAGEWDLDRAALFGASLHKQCAGTLGDRLQAACEESETLGYSEIVVIGADHPTLPGAYLEEAFRIIRKPDTAVLGPTSDGGFYLLGMNTYAPEAFEGKYSHPNVFRETRERIVRIWNRVHQLPEWYDVDRADDLERLIKDLHTGADCPNTCLVLERLSWL